jgi:hypothetical protein
LGMTCRSANIRCVSTVFFEAVATTFKEHDADRTGQAGKM